MSAFAPGDIPEIDSRVICVIDRENVALAAVISSYLVTPGKYFPLFTFPGVEHPDDGQDSIEDDEFVTTMIGSQAAIVLGNALARIEANDYVILAGLSEAQKSYINLPEQLKVVEIRNVGDVSEKLATFGIRKQSQLRCKAGQVHLGLFQAIANGSALQIVEAADDLASGGVASLGAVVLEARLDHAASVIAINYASSVGAEIKLLPPVNRKTAHHILDLFQFWKDIEVDQARDELFDEIDGRIGSLKLDGYDWVTFFTDGIPYSLRLNVPGICTYVHLSNHADHFIINNLLAESTGQLPSAVVFAIDEFLETGEGKAVAARLEQANFFVRFLTGRGATGFSFGYHAEHFPYGLFHIVSHGGQVDGHSVTDEFVDRMGVKHVIHYDEVVGLQAVLTEPGMVGVQRKNIFIAIDDIDWYDDERKNALPHYVYVDMFKHTHDSDHWGKESKRTPCEIVFGSCHVKCNDGIHQAMFRSVGGYGTPVVFNNACWSWWGVSDFFVGGGARAYLGTLWAVKNQIAVEAADVFYEHAIGGNIASAVREANRSIEHTEDAGIYALWGLHFSTFAKGVTLPESVYGVCDRLSTLMKMYGRALEQGIAADDARDNAIETLELLDIDLDALCEGPGVDKLRARVAQTLAKVGPKSRFKKP